MIRLENVCKTYQTGVPALKDINIDIAPGEFVFITGPSGSGKSTIIKLLLHELIVTEGKIFVNDKDVSKLSHKNIPYYRRNIGVVFQDFRLLQDRNVFENVAFAMKVLEDSNKKIKRIVPKMLAMVGLAPKYRALPKQLSGGEQQRVAIARALVNNPKILLADEPTGNLDDKNGWEIMHLLEAINERGTTVVVVTHNMEFVEKMNKRVITLKKGTVVDDRKPSWE
jgi:hypothetical protein